MIHSTDRELLRSCSVKRPKDIATHSLAELFGLRRIRPDQTLRVAEEPFSYPLPNRLMAARELLRRALAETLADTSVSLASPGAVRDYLRLFLAGQEYESFLALWLDAQNRLIAGMELFRGTTTQTSVYPREVVRAGLKLNASAVILAHNHPSGLAEPSRADELLTSELKQALALVDIRVLDHFIVADTAVLSFAERGLI
jgi:DNA repair protein RadC